MTCVYLRYNIFLGSKSERRLLMSTSNITLVMEGTPFMHTSLDTLSYCGVFWTKFEHCTSKIRRILINFARAERVVALSQFVRSDCVVKRTVRASESSQNSFLSTTILSPHCSTKVIFSTLATCAYKFYKCA